jgi:tetratricopeptide (TPR) repeat protein
LWSVDGWEKTWQGAGQSFSAIAVAPGGRTVAVETGAGVIVLYETQSGREIARLTDPDGHRQVEFAFSPDQRYLAGITYDFKHLCLWELSEIGDRLQELGLAWDWPAPRPESARSDSPGTGGTRPLSAVFLEENLLELQERELEAVSQQLVAQPTSSALHARRGMLLLGLDRSREAVAALTEAIRLEPSAPNFSLRSNASAAAGDDENAITDAESALSAAGQEPAQQARFCNELAWSLVMGPSRPGQFERAVELARRAVRLDRSRPSYFNTLGVAHTRCGEWDLAIDALHRSLLAGYATAAGDLYFLSICYQRLNDERRAREAFDQAVYWHDRHAARLNRQIHRELNQFRSEAERALGLHDGAQDVETGPRVPP